MLSGFFSLFSGPVISLVAFLVIISILVLAHELGHFIFARLLGVGVEEFAVGLPFTKPLWTKLRKDKLRVSVYPALFGGFVRLMGEENLDEVEHPKLKKGEKKEFQFWAKPPWARLLIIIAGVLANVVFAVLAFSVIFYFTGVPRETNHVHIVGVSPDSPAAKAGIKDGDIVVGIEAQEKAKQGPGQLEVGKAITSTGDFINFIENYKGQKIEIELQRGKEILRVNAVPRVNPPNGEGSLGVAITTTEPVFLPFPWMIAASLKEGAAESWRWVKITVVGVAAVLREVVVGKVPAGVGGPLRIAQVSGVVVKEGPITILSFLGVLSVNLAVVNILPFPALDGGHALFLIFEAIFGRRIAPKIEHWVHTVGLAILLILVLLITIHDAESILGESGLLHKVSIFK